MLCPAAKPSAENSAYLRVVVMTSARVIKNNFPAVRRFMEQQCKDTGRFPARLLGSLQMKSPQHGRVARTEHMDFKIGKTQCAHLLWCRIAFQIACQNLRVTLRNGRANERR